MKNESRKKLHQKPKELEKSLEFFEEQLAPINRILTDEGKLSNHPMVFVVGCARSGTTLVYQYLSYTGLFSYPTNFISRFFYAPLIGAKLQKMLFDFDFRGEIFPSICQEHFSFESNLGKTSGPLAPHEFWYFWRRFFEFGDDQATLCAEPNFEQCIKELRAFQEVQDRPLVMKAMNLNWHLPKLAESYNRAFFVFVQRDVESNAASLVKARNEFFGNENDWYSFKPPGYQQVLAQSPLDQTRWQVNKTNQAITEGLEKIENDRIFAIRLNDFRENPQKVVASICERWQHEMPSLDHLPSQFGLR